MKNISIYNTFIHPSASQKVNEVLHSTFLSEGKKVQEFESQLSSYLGIQNPLAVNSGTTALHLALDIAGVKEGDEVILPSQTFVATGLVILQQKAIPVFADINYGDGNISIASIKQKITTKTKAIICVHWGGYPCDMDEILSIAKENNLVVIEDAAHALGAVYKNNCIGSLSDYTCFSFQAIKHITTGDGGAIAFRDKSKHDEGYAKRWFGINRDTATQTELGERNYNIETLGYKYHLNDYSASLGIANLVGFKERLAHRDQIVDLYNRGLEKINGIKLFDHKNDRQSANWLYGFHVENRLDFIRKLKSHGISASVIHQRIDRNKVFGGITKNLTDQERFELSQIHIPIHDNITLEDAKYIIDTIKTGW
jgi:perosamine synthetase